MKGMSIFKTLCAVTALVVSMSANAYTRLTAIGGSAFGTGEGVENMVDGKASTKWCQKFNPGGETDNQHYLVVKAATSFVPSAYFLITGDDTGRFPERNWSSWKIWGANFDSDAEALAVQPTAGKPGAWVLVDNKEDERIPSKNAEPVDFQCSQTNTTAYQYYYIDVLDNAQHGEAWTQMSEFGFGSYAEFEEYLSNKVDDPITYKLLAGDGMSSGGEGLAKLFDNNYYTKWGMYLTANKEGDTQNGAYFIIKTNRPMAPTYYKLVTGTDAAQWNNRSWKQWQIYGIADVDVEDEAKLSRTSQGWVAIDKKYDVGRDVLPDINSHEVYLELSENSTTKYRYFKVEINATAGGAYMQMSEFALGDEYTFLLDRQKMVDEVEGSVNVEKTFQQTVKDAYTVGLTALKNAINIFDAKEKLLAMQPLMEDALKSINAYDAYNAVVATLRAHLTHTCMTNPEGKEKVRQYVEDMVAPGALFKNGSYRYVMANALLDVPGINRESKEAQVLLEANANDLYEGAITDATYTTLAGTGWGSGEGPQNLVDGNEGTKWCVSNIQYIVFKCNEGTIAPTYYDLLTSNDTKLHSGRNWKDWDIYGANFTDDVVDAIETTSNNEKPGLRNLAGWTLIDTKRGVGTDQLPADNFTTATFNMTSGGQAYQYFKIEVRKNVSGDYTQMSELTFANTANFMLLRKEMIDQYADVDFSETACYQKLKDEYEEAYFDLKTCSNAQEMSDAINRMESLRKQIAANESVYEAYMEQCGMMSASDFSNYNGGTTGDWAAKYFATSAEEPSVLLPRGNYAYIMQNLPYDTDDIVAETDYLKDMLRAALLDESGETVGFVYIDGNVVGQWSDGHPSYLVDNIIDAPGVYGPATKMGGNIDTSGNTYVIFKTMEPYNPFFYTLITGSDTYIHQDRNPGSWTIYGANFNGDGEATKDAEGWVVVDEKKNIGKDRMLPQNLTASYFGFSSETTTPYQYYKIVIWGNFDGQAGPVQLQELQFGTVEQFEEIRSKYSEAAEEFDTDVKAYKPYLETYQGMIGSIDECINMEVLYRINKDIELMRDTITASVATYAVYDKKVTDAKELLKANEVTDAPGYEAFNGYINGDSEPCELYPNGAYGYIWEELNVQDSILLREELPLLQQLQAAYVSKSYIAGTDLTSMVQNANFEAMDGWDGTAFYSNDMSANRLTGAAEWCVTDDGKFDVSQTLTGLKAGYYLVSMGAAYRPNARDAYSYNQMALAYANDAAVLVPTIREDMVPFDLAEDGVNCHLTGNIPDHLLTNPAKPASGEEYVKLGYVAWGVEGAIQAFKAGRYRNLLVAKVEADGILTIGVRNVGSPLGDDWTTVGDVHVRYLGNDASASLVTDALAASNAIAAKRGHTLYYEYRLTQGEDVTTLKELEVTPLYSTEVDEMCAVAAVTPDALLAASLFNDAFARVPAEKLAYVNLWKFAEKVQEKWESHEFEENNVLEDTDDVYTSIMSGDFDLAGTQMAADELLRTYPEYFGIKTTESAGETTLSVVNATAKETAPFEYELVFTGGKRPYAAFDGLYNAADEARNILKLEYKSSKAIDDCTLNFYHPAFEGNSDVLPTLEACADWQTIYVSVADARQEYGWLDAQNHGMQIDFTSTTNAEAGQKFSLRHICLVTKDEMEAEGGTLNAIDDICAPAAPALKGIYNLAGQRVSRATKGLYIIDGRVVKY